MTSTSISNSDIYFVIHKLLYLGWNLQEIIDHSEIRKRRIQSYVRRNMDKNSEENRKTKKLPLRFTASWKKLAEILLIERSDISDTDCILEDILKKLLDYETETARFNSALAVIERLQDPIGSALEPWQNHLVRDLWPEVFTTVGNHRTIHTAFLQAIAQGEIVRDGCLDFTDWLIDFTKTRESTCLAIEGWKETVNGHVAGLLKSRREVLIFFYEISSKKENWGRSKNGLVAETGDNFGLQESTVRRYLTKARRLLRTWLAEAGLWGAVLPLATRRMRTRTRS